MSAPVTPAPETLSSGQPALSEPQRILNMFYAPSSTFEDIKRNAKWWGPLVLMIVMAYAGSFTLQKKISSEDLVESILTNMSEKQKARIEAAPPEQQTLVRQRIASQVKIFSNIGWVLYLVAALIMAAVLMATFNFGLGKEVGYWTSMAVVMYAFVPSALKSLLFIIKLFAGVDPQEFNIQNPVPTNPGFFVNANEMPVLAPLLQTFDIFTIWITILMGIGFAVVTRSKKSTGIGVVAGWLVVVTIVKMGFAAIF
jgi:Yip1 domain